MNNPPIQPTESDEIEKYFPGVKEAFPRWAIAFDEVYSEPTLSGNDFEFKGINLIKGCVRVSLFYESEPVSDEGIEITISCNVSVNGWQKFGKDIEIEGDYAQLYKETREMLASYGSMGEAIA